MTDEIKVSDSLLTSLNSIVGKLELAGNNEDSNTVRDTIHLVLSLQYELSEAKNKLEALNADKVEVVPTDEEIQKARDRLYGSSEETSSES